MLTEFVFNEYIDIIKVPEEWNPGYYEVTNLSTGKKDIIFATCLRKAYYIAYDDGKLWGFMKKKFPIKVSFKRKK